MSGTTTATIKRLFAVSGNQCAFPGCTLPLVTGNKVTGRICHIKACSPKGPRYDPNQDEKERHGFDNLILMCPAHHDVIDADPATYTIEKLLAIKTQHQTQHAGGPEPCDDIARQFLVQIDVQAQNIGILGDHAILYGDIVFGDKIIQPPRPTPPTYTPPPTPDSDTLPDPGPLPPGYRLPFSRNALFTGREQPLKALAQALLHDGAASTLITQAVQGMGGIGKTQLAVEFAYRYGRFFHGVHWISAAQPENIGTEVAACGRAMSLPNWPAEQLEQIRYTLSEWQCVGPRLVILDNLEDVKAAREWLRRLSGGEVRLLLTARRRVWPRDLGLGVLRLDVFTPEKSRAFLRQYLNNRRAEDEDLNKLAKRLGHLPLALDLAGRYLDAYSSLSVDAYLAEFEHILDHESMLSGDEEMGSPTNYDLGLEATFELSWERVADSAAYRLFQLAGYCAPNQPIPGDLLKQASDLDDKVYDKALYRLVSLGLLNVTEEDALPSIHPLLAEYTRHQKAERAPLPALADALVRLTKAANDQMDQTGSPSHFVPFLPHVRLVAETAEAEAAKDTASLLHNLGRYLNRVADYAGARTAYERALVIRERVYEPSNSNIAATVNNLGLVLHDMGELAEARKAYERALAIDEATLGPNHPNVALRLNNLGTLLRELGELVEARKAHERALAIDEVAYGPDHPKVARDVHNLGRVLHDMGELAEARKAYERSLAIDEAAYGPDHPEVATDANNLGMLLHDLGELAEARKAYERALAIFEVAYGPDHPDVAAAVTNLGGVLQDLGELVEARKAHERALAIWRDVHGEVHPKVASGHNNLGSVLSSLGEKAEARKAYERALAINEAVYGPNHPQVAICLNNLAYVLHDMGELAEARKAYERALAIDEATLGPNHPNVALRLNNLGFLLYALGERAEARKAYERALAIWEKSLPPDHPSIKTVRRNLEILRPKGGIRVRRRWL